MLAVGSRLTPVDRTGLIFHRRTGESHVLAVALHRQLLQIGREALQVLVVRENCDSLRAKEVVIPYAEKAHEHWYVVFKWCAAKMLVDLMEASQHGAEMFWANGQHGRKPDR